MRCIIAGTRKDFDYRRFVEIIKQCPFIDEIEVVVSGRADGVDRMGELWAESAKKVLFCYAANWKKHGKKAGPLRNEEMAQNADALIAIPMGKSPGTRDMIRRAAKYRLRTWIYELTEGTEDGDSN